MFSTSCSFRSLVERTAAFGLQIAGAERRECRRQGSVLHQHTRNGRLTKIFSCSGVFVMTILRTSADRVRTLV